MQNDISHVKHGSPAYRAGIREYDRLISVDGKPIRDVLDYMYYAYGDDSVFTIRHPDGSTEEFHIRKDFGQDAGLDFETYLMDKARSCANNCIFCFVDQLPEGMRDTLYFKDDDVRLSFLTGSYITLTNMSEREIQRIIDLRISPINVSIHTMDKALRCMMLGNKRAGEGIDIVRRLAAHDIEMNCQIVCCPEVNDGEHLLYTMQELEKLWPSVNSVAIIPVGLTRFREGLYPLKPFTKEHAAETLRLIEDFGETCLEKHRSRIFFPSDEFYLKAGREMPDEDFYEGYPQLENGVGLIRNYVTEFEGAIADCPEEAKGTPFSLATGLAAGYMLAELLRLAKAKWPAIRGSVYPIYNDFFGHSIDVAGLITGRDLVAQLKGKELGEAVYITNRMLKDDEDIFLDDMTLAEASAALGVPIIPMKNSGEELLRVMLQ
ncbi:MAG: DUF512 domain-containing protein [bacterium]